MKMILIAVSLALASGTVLGDQDFGHWSVGMTNDKNMAYAATENDDGAVFGEYCSFNSKTCYWEVISQTSCDKGKDYPVLANSDKGAISLTLNCLGASNRSGWYESVFKNWKDVEAIAKTGSIVGIAMPLQADRFTVQRFLLDGLTTSTEFLESKFFSAVSPSGKPKGTPTSDTRAETL